ncbi:MAG: hypothetical protein ACFCUI_09725 [Bernardetiaceae bacterium]
MPNTTFSWICLIFLSFGLLSACDEDPDLGEAQFPEGQIWATIENTFFRFDTPGGLRPQDANGYVAANQFVNITRQTSERFYGVAQIRLLRTQLEDLTYPATLSENFVFTFRPEPNVAFTGRDGSVQILLERFEDDLLEGTFSGTIRNEDNPGQALLVREGRFKIRLLRF